MKQFNNITTALVITIAITYHPFAFCQNIGINNTGNPPNSRAMLDVDQAGKGLLIPRMVKADRDTITSVPTSLLIYQTDNIPGYYYYNGTAWVQLFSNNSGWSLTGNAGTTPATNFLGTTDNVSLRFRTNNTEKMIIDSLGNGGIGLTSPAAKLDISGDGVIVSSQANVNDILGLNYATLRPVLVLNRQSTTSGGSQISFRRGIQELWAIGVDSPDNLTQDMYFYSGLAPAGVKMTILGSGNVGIGTTVPNSPLHVVGQMGKDSTLLIESNFTGGGATLIVKNSSDSGDVAVDFHSGDSLIGNIGYVISDSVPRFFILQNNPNNLNLTLVDGSVPGQTGNVGIGTTSPGAKLEVGGGVRLNTSDSKPTCDSSQRGTIWFSQLDSATKEYVKARIYAVTPGYAGNYNIQYSDDNSIWSNAATGFIPSLLGWNEISWASIGTHRYWRFYLTNTPGPGSWLQELEMYVVGNINDDPSSSMLSQSGLTYFDAVATVDNNSGTNAWHTDSSSPGAWLKMDVGAEDKLEVCTKVGGIYVWRTLY